MSFGRKWKNWGGFGRATPHEWYTTVRFGSGPYPMPPRGPWKSLDEAHAAMDRWRARVGSLAGTIIAAHHIEIVGPYKSRRAARAADISDEV